MRIPKRAVAKITKDPPLLSGSFVIFNNQLLVVDMARVVAGERVQYCTRPKKEAVVQRTQFLLNAIAQAKHGGEATEELPERSEWGQIWIARPADAPIGASADMLFTHQERVWAYSPQEQLGWSIRSADFAAQVAQVMREQPAPVFFYTCPVVPISR